MNHCVVVFGVELFSLKPQSCVCMSVELHTTIYQKKWQYFIASLRGVCVCVWTQITRLEWKKIKIDDMSVVTYFLLLTIRPCSTIVHHSFSESYLTSFHAAYALVCVLLFCIFHVARFAIIFSYFFFVFLLIAQESWIFFPLLLICRCNPIPLFAAQPPQPPRHTRIQSQPGRTWTISLMLMCASVLHCMMRVYAYMYSCICMTGNARNTIHDEKYGVE